jgi:hypothetical protein
VLDAERRGHGQVDRLAARLAEGVEHRRCEVDEVGVGDSATGEPEQHGTGPDAPADTVALEQATPLEVANEIAEEVAGVAPPDYKIDEATTIASASTAHGILTLSRPDSGWADGKYRVEFYLDQTFIDAVKVKIGK